MILLVDDNPAICEALELLLSLEAYESISCHSPAAALEILKEKPINLAIVDMNFSADTTSGAEGRELFHAMRKERDDLPIILLTAWTQVESAVAMVKAGAADYLAKPWDDDKLLTTVKNLLELNELQDQAKALRKEQQEHEHRVACHDLCGLIYHSRKMQNLVEMALQVAQADIPVLITGPNGSGKEKIAEIIQANSRLKQKPFIKINAGALPHELIESELFGAEAGAFTGNTKTRIGRFEAADGGTLFLDEIGNLPMAGQVKLLRVIQSGEFERLGSSQTRKVKVRIISATNSNLKEAIVSGHFREDLYYRLNVIELKLPPLKERREDIIPLAESFLDPGLALSDGAEHALKNYDWPGNARELQNVMKRAQLFCKNGVVNIEDLALEGLTVPDTDNPRTLTKDDIEAALNKHRGIVAKAARSLGLSRQALYRRMDKYDIPRP